MKRFSVRAPWAAAVLAALLATAGCGAPVTPSGYQSYSAASPNEPASPGKPNSPPVLTRLFFQDYKTKTLKWADVLDGPAPSLKAVGTVEGFPPLDPERQQLVQMEVEDGLVLVGVRENGDERRENGWVLIDAGVEKEDHGDHSHWGYASPPKARARRLDGKQGNPAHLYLYDRVFYLANDENSGYTRLDPAAIGPHDDEAAIRAKAAFHLGGGRHITLAVAGGRVGYSAWIDGGGPNKGRVDVTPIKPEGNTAIARSFSLPSGGIHGAACCAGKVFFAPADGLCWVAADGELNTETMPEVHHISLGNDTVADKPLRTGAFATVGKHVLCVAGEGPTAILCVLDASVASPEVVKVDLDMQAGNRPVTPELVATHGGKSYAFVFHNHPQDVNVDDRLGIVDLDPDGDGDFGDAAAVKSLKVGLSRVEGHYGHHSIAFDADGSRAFFTNPGAGTLVVLDLKTLEPLVENPLGGIPTKVLAWGGREESH